MIQVKHFMWDALDEEYELNNWLLEQKDLIEVIDIKFTATEAFPQNDEGIESGSFCYALVIYKV